MHISYLYINSCMQSYIHIYMLYIRIYKWHGCLGSYNKVEGRRFQENAFPDELEGWESGGETSRGRERRIQAEEVYFQQAVGVRVSQFQVSFRYMSTFAMRVDAR